jgi:5-(carboxyamino)imidazole ribonucleotide mutase/phosphoribosylaminoimidazole-succinocarboxamide synthase
MPSGIAPALVLEPANAALLAAKMIGMVDAEVRAAVKAYQKGMQATILSDDEALRSA